MSRKRDNTTSSRCSSPVKFPELQAGIPSVMVKEEGPSRNEESNQPSVGMLCVLGKHAQNQYHYGCIFVWKL